MRCGAVEVEERKATEEQLRLCRYRRHHQRHAPGRFVAWDLPGWVGGGVVVTGRVEQEQERHWEVCNYSTNL